MRQAREAAEVLRWALLTNGLHPADLSGSIIETLVGFPKTTLIQEQDRLFFFKYKIIIKILYRYYYFLLKFYIF